ncbi:MAG TPA: alanine racemase [Gemmatimonadales bacterium]|jgi:D-serine deaminase-like pyridoxal phosphate-dependent protein
MQLPRSIAEIPTPALLLDSDILVRNIARMSERIRGLGARLRPHIKTHKCIEIGRLQVEHGARGITASTLVEARDFADHGFDDITWAFPLVPGRMDEIVALARRITFRLMVESPEAADALEQAARAAGIRIHTWLEVDCGYHRSGVDPNDPASIELARRLGNSKHLVFDGLLTHAGHSYHARDAAERRRVAAEERGNTVAFAAQLREKRIDTPMVSVGSTPSMVAAESLEGVDEARPGNYAFFDYMQVATGVCQPGDVAVSVLTSVVSHQEALPHCIVDAGALAMSKDAGPAHADMRRGLGPVMTSLTGSAIDPRVDLTHVSQEHGFIGGPRHADVTGRFKVGDKLRIMPNHSCLTAAMFDEYWVTQGDLVVDRWKILRGR